MNLTQDSWDIESDVEATMLFRAVSPCECAYIWICATSCRLCMCLSSSVILSSESS